jgi:hypothetical protein
MSPRHRAETRKETASKTIATGALSHCTRPPARAGPPISATESLAPSVLLAATRRSSGHDRWQEGLVSHVKDHGEDAHQGGYHVQRLDAQHVQQRGQRDRPHEQRAPHVRRYQGGPAGQAIDPRAGRQADHQDRRGSDRRQLAHLHRYSRPLPRNTCPKRCRNRSMRSRVASRRCNVGSPCLRT